MNRLITRAALVAIAGLSLGACSTYGSGGYGYSRVAVGYGNGYYSDPYYGWYDGYYYPGAGYYVWDRQGYRHRWSSSHQRYWMQRRGDRRVSSNWSGYQHRRLGDYRAAPTRAYREQRPAVTSRYRSQRPDVRYSGNRPAITQRYRGNRSQVEAPRRYREQRPEQATRGRGHEARDDKRRGGNDRRHRNKRDD